MPPKLARPSYYFYEQRDFYHQALSDLGIQLFSGTDGFYHWGKSPSEMNADDFKLETFQARCRFNPADRAICIGTANRDPNRFIRFSVGPLREEDVRFLEQRLGKWS